MKDHQRLIVERFQTDEQVQGELSRLFANILDAVRSGSAQLRQDRSGQLCFINLEEIDPHYSTIQLGLYPQNVPLVVKGLNGKAWIAVLTADHVVHTTKEFIAILQEDRPQFFHEMTHIFDLLRYKNRTEPFVSGSTSHVDWDQHDNMPSEMNANFHQAIREFEHAMELSINDEASRPIIAKMQKDFKVFLSIIRRPEYFSDTWGRLNEMNKRRLIKRLFAYWQGRFGGSSKAATMS